MLSPQELSAYKILEPRDTQIGANIIELEDGEGLYLHVGLPKS